MKRVVLIVVVLVALGAATVALWPAPQPVMAPVHEAPGVELPDFAPVAVQGAAGQQGLSLTGTVKDARGQPLADAEVFLSASAQPTLVGVRCGTCGDLLLSCPAAETGRAVHGLLESHRGELTAAATTRTDAAGAFRFERLVGVSFTVWARAPGHGEGLKERAAPGDPVALFLPALRSIAGRLLDEDSRPVQGQVRVISRRLAHIVEAASDEQGRFTLTGLGEGPFYLSASAPGLLPAFLPQVEAGPEPVQVTLRTPRRLEVRLIAAGQPVEGRVQLAGDHLDRQAEAPGGLAVLEGLYPGELILTAQSGALSSAPQQVALESLTTQVTVTLESGGKVLVTVVDEAGQPVPNPKVVLATPAGETITTRTLRTGDLAVLGPYAPGDYLLRASARGFQDGAVPVALKVGEVTADVTLTRGTVISGRVIDEYGRSAPGVSVLVQPTGDSVLADAQAEFSALVPSPGLYTLHAHHSDWGGGMVSVTAPATGVELQLEPKAGVEVTVTVDGRRVEGANVILFTTDGNFRSDRPSGADGVVLMRGMPPGTYALIASHPEYLPSERTMVTLEDGRLDRVEVQLRAGAGISGQVVDTLGAPVASVSVHVVPRGAEPAKTDGTGHFSISPLRPDGLYVLRVADRGYEPVERTLAKAGGEPVRLVVKRQQIFRGRVLGDGQPLRTFRVDDFEVTAADGRFELPLPASDERVIVMVEAPGWEPLMEDRPLSPELGDFNLSRAPLVTGVVKDDGGAPVPDAVVTCDTCERSVLSGADGRFTLSRPAFQREFVVVAKKGRRTATRTVTSDAATNLELVLRPGVRLFGLVALPNGQPAAGVEVAGIHVDRSETLSVVTNADGTYATEVAPGIYRFVVASQDFAQAAADPPATIVEVTGPETRLDFGLVPGQGQLKVRLTPARGYALWLVKGTVTRVANPPMELLRSSWAQMVYQPRSATVTFGALPPGHYTLVWGAFHAEAPTPPLLVPVDVPGPAEVSLVR